MEVTHVGRNELAVTMKIATNLSLAVQHSEALASIIFALQLALYQLQIRHLLEIVDALLMCNQRKTLGDLSRFLHLAPDPKTLADFLRESPWTVDLVSQPRKQFMVRKLLELEELLAEGSQVYVLFDSWHAQRTGDEILTHCLIPCIFFLKFCLFLYPIFGDATPTIKEPEYGLDWLL